MRGLYYQLNSLHYHQLELQVWLQLNARPWSRFLSLLTSYSGQVNNLSDSLVPVLGDAPKEESLMWPACSLKLIILLNLTGIDLHHFSRLTLSRTNIKAAVSSRRVWIHYIEFIPYSIAKKKSAKDDLIKSAKVDFIKTVKESNYMAWKKAASWLEVMRLLSQDFFAKG